MINKLFALIFLFMLLSSCSSVTPKQYSTPPEPVVFDLKPPPSTATILLATDRKRDTNHPNTFYTNQQSMQLMLGEVFIDYRRDGSHIDGSITSVQEFGILANTALTNPASPLEHQAFEQLLTDSLTAKHSDTVLIFVHGFKDGFSKTVVAASSVAHYISPNSLPIAFSWAGGNGISDYLTTTELTRISARNLRLLIEDISQLPSVNQINLVAHSAGTRVALEALFEIGLQDNIEAKRTVNQLVLLASDMDPHIALMMIDEEVEHFVPSIEIYTSSSDWPLGFSHMLYGDQRLGQIQPDDVSHSPIKQLIDKNSVSVISVDNADQSTKDFGHSYYRLSPWVGADLVSGISLGLAPADRGLVKTSEGIWVFPEDYEQRLKAQLAKQTKPL